MNTYEKSSMTIITIVTTEGREFSGNPKPVTDEKILLFSGGSRHDSDFPKKTIHTSLEFAKSCGLSKRAASGAMFEGYLAELMISLFGEGWLNHGKMNLTFIAVVEPGDTLVAKAVIQSRHAESSNIRFVMEVWCENQHGNKVVVGTATGLVQ